jgi:hypothetical protein
MANVDRPIGFRTYGDVLSLRPYDIETATAVFINDLVSADAADGYIDAATAGATCMIGASQEYHTTGAVAIIVADHPHQLFLCQDNAGATLTVADNHSCADHEAGSGSSTTMLSGHELDASTAGNTNTGFTIVDLDDRPDNAWGAWGDLIVRPYDHKYGATGDSA